jgi:hypothetical protein
MSQRQQRDKKACASADRLKWFLNQPEFALLLLATFPVLTLAADNAREIAIRDTIRPITLTLLGTSLIYLAFRAIGRNSGKSALATAWVVLLFFSYGHVYLLLKRVQFLGETIGRHRYLVPLSVILTLAALWLIFRKLRKAYSVTASLTIAALAVSVVPLLRLGVNAFQARSKDTIPSSRSTGTLNLSASYGGSLPDIYYIILDSYGRSDVLKKIYAYDNSEFLRELEKLGFYVASESASNYSYTILSIASSMNYAYLQDLGLGLDPSQSVSDWYSLAPLIKNSQIREDLSGIGYLMTAFETGYIPTRVDNADIFLSPDLQGPFAAISAISPFETLLIETSALKVLVDVGTNATKLISPYARHRAMILFQLDSLKQIPRMQQPTFVFAHIMAPHKPYVFGPQGEPRTPAEVFTLGDQDAPGSSGTDRNGFIDQTVFIEDQIIDVITTILNDSDESPIIIIQGDHGLPIGDVSASDRMAILNAYYLPQSARSKLYPEISPVNTFRVVLTSIFNADLYLLDDKAYYSRYPNLFDMMPIELP